MLDRPRNAQPTPLPHAALRALIQFYYPTIEFTGRHHIPPAGPVLFVANHPNALLDPVVLGLAARRPIHFLAKAPLFAIPIFGQLLHALGMLPAYRACDDPSQMKRNLDSLALAAHHLIRGSAVGIFPEGKSQDQARVDQIKTGAARIALQAAAGGASSLLVVPIGLNYQRKEQFGSAIWVNVAPPIHVQEWIERHPEPERAQVKALTQEIDRQLKRVAIHLDEPALESFLDDLEFLHPPPAGEPQDDITRLRHRKRIADAMNWLLDTDRVRAETTAAAIQQYRQALLALGLTVASVPLDPSIRSLRSSMARTVLALVAGFLLNLPATAHHLAPFFINRLLARTVQTHARSTFALSRLGFGLAVYGAWYVLVAWWLATSFHPWVAALWCGLMPGLGILALRYCYSARHAASRLWRAWPLLRKPDSVLSQLRAQREQLNLASIAVDFAAAVPRHD